MGRRTFLDLLVTLFLVHPRIPLAFLAMRALCWLKWVSSSHVTVLLSSARGFLTLALLHQEVPPMEAVLHELLQPESFPWAPQTAPAQAPSMGCTTSGTGCSSTGARKSHRAIPLTYSYSVWLLMQLP